MVLNQTGPAGEEPATESCQAPTCKSYHASRWVSYSVNCFLLGSRNLYRAQIRGSQSQGAAVKIRRVFLDYVGTSADIFMPFGGRNRFSRLSFHFFFKKPRGKSRPVVDSCTRLIRLIRFFSDKAPSLTRVSAHPLFCTLLLDGWEWDCVFARAGGGIALSSALAHAPTSLNGSN